MFVIICLLVMRSISNRSYQVFLVAFVCTSYFQLHFVGFFVHLWDIRVKDYSILLYVSFKPRRAIASPPH